ncbi:MAG: plasmid pRiA4b ORF-3 family protein, partial [Pseudomonadota bacterium]|nr:plasmid pRiA4b ORF-3 family protein [Pseudomonadota bacterium]
ALIAPASMSSMNSDTEATPDTLTLPLALRLDDLHLFIQAVMGWENYHLYEFRVGRDIAYGVPDPDWADLGQSCLPAMQASLAELLKHVSSRTKAFTYVYDFGDNWHHTVMLEAIAAA